jgi:hypothetical protein
LPPGGMLVIGIAEPRAHQLGYDLGQNAIIVGSADSCRILYMRPDRGN